MFAHSKKKLAIEEKIIKYMPKKEKNFSISPKPGDRSLYLLRQDLISCGIRIFHRHIHHDCYKEWWQYYQACNLPPNLHENSNVRRRIRIFDQKNLEHIGRSHTCRYHDWNIVVHFLDKTEKNKNKIIINLCCL